MPVEPPRASASPTPAPEVRAPEREALLRAIIETSPDGLITIDQAGLILSSNPAAQRMFGYAAAEVVGRNVRCLMPPPYREQHDGYVARYLRTGEKRIIGIGREVLGQRLSRSGRVLTPTLQEMPLMQDDGFGPWLLGIVLAVISLLGLFLASAATDAVFYGVGLIFFLFGVLMIFGLIARSTRPAGPVA